MTEPARVYDLLFDQENGLADAADAVRAGQCVVLPTDTVYGIGANAFDSDAVQRLLDAKERGRDMPPPVLIAEPSMLRAIVDGVPKPAADLAEALWPGALTLILKAQKKSGMDLGETDGTIAVRVPDHDGARALLRRTGPLAVSSANVSGQDAATSCGQAQEMLGDRVAVYLNAGDAPGGVASTIVDFASTPEGKVLRLGAISMERLTEIAPGVEGPEPQVPEAAEPAEPVVEIESSEDVIAVAEAETETAQPGEPENEG